MSDPASDPSLPPADPSAPVTFLALDPPAGVKRLLAKPDLLIRGRVSDPRIGAVWIEVPGAAPLDRPVASDGTFEAKLGGLALSTTEVTVRAGAPPREAVARIPIAIAGASPKVTVTAPGTWAGGSLDVSCLVEAWRPKRARIFLEVDGVPFGAPIERALEIDGVAQASLKPPPTARALRVAAEGEDEKGRKGVGAVDVAVDRSGPRVSIAEPRDGLETADATIAFAGTARGSAVALAAVELTFAGRARKVAVDAEGRIAVAQLDVPEMDGDYEIELRATDDLGNAGRASATIRARRQAAAKAKADAEASRARADAEAAARAKADADAAAGREVEAAAARAGADAAARPARGFIHRAPGGLEIEMVYVPPGEFFYGDDKERRTLAKGFHIGKYETTWKEYLAFCAATGHERPSAPTWGVRDDHPVVNVRATDADAFCRWAGLALPTDEMWEKAARGTDGRKYPWGNEPPTPDRCVWEKHPTCGRSTAPVGSCRAGASPCGAFDMAGNVSEWTSTGTTGARPQRVHRGGSWGVEAERCRAAFRSLVVASMPVDLIGFRPCLPQS